MYSIGSAHTQTNAAKVIGQYRWRKNPKHRFVSQRKNKL